MKRMVICLAFVLLFAGASAAQTKTMTGTVIDYSQGNKGNWEGIIIKVGSRTYFVYLSTVDYPAAKRVETIDQAGRAVKIYNKNISNSGKYAGDVIATRVVGIKESKKR